MKKLLLVLIAASFCIAPNAHALATESWIIDIASVVNPAVQGVYDRGTIYDGITTPGTWSPIGAPAGAKVFTDGVYDTSVDGIEDTWGVFQIKSIVGSVSGTVFDSTTTADQIVGMFYGFDDIYISDNLDGSAAVKSQFGAMELWKNSGDFDAAILAGSTGRTAANAYTGITSGTQLLSTTAHGRLAWDPVSQTFVTYTYKSDFDFTAPYGGRGDIYFDVNPSVGMWGVLLDTDGFDVGTATDADIQISFSAQSSGVQSDWVVYGNGQGNANAVIPEPTSMILMGIGLAGAALRRRRMG